MCSALDAPVVAPLTLVVMHKIMKNILFSIICVCGISIGATANALADTKRLNDFQTVSDFEEYLALKKQDCIDKSFGGSRAIACFTSYSEAWDYELNFYYKLLRKSLNNEEKESLKKAQLSWITNRDTTIHFNSKLLDKEFKDKNGTMYVAIRAGKASSTIVPIIKNRALLLKEWSETVAKGK